MRIVQCCARVTQCNLTSDQIRFLQHAGFVETRHFTDNEAVVWSNKCIFLVYKLSVATAHHSGSTAIVTAIYNLRSRLICNLVYTRVCMASIPIVALINHHTPSTTVSFQSMNLDAAYNSSQ